MEMPVMLEPVEDMERHIRSIIVVEVLQLNIGKLIIVLRILHLVLKEDLLVVEVVIIGVSLMRVLVIVVMREKRVLLYYI